MTALAANKTRRIRSVGSMRVGELTGVDSDEFYEGGLVSHNNSGRVAPSSDTANHKIAGVAVRRQTTGSSNTDKVRFEWGHEEWFPQDGNLGNAALGLDACILDDQTLTNAGTATNDIRAGKIVELETIGGVAGAWIVVGVFGTAAAA